MMKSNLDKDPTYWVVQYDVMGWSITSSCTQVSFMINERQAQYAIGAIHRAKKVYNHFTAETKWGLALI